MHITALKSLKKNKGRLMGGFKGILTKKREISITKKRYILTACIHSGIHVVFLNPYEALCKPNPYILTFSKSNFGRKCQTVFICAYSS